MFFTIGSSKNNDLTITAKTDASIDLFGLPAPSPVADLAINTRVTFTGRLSPDLSWAEIDVISKNFMSNVFSVNRIKWNLKYSSPGRFVLTKTGDNIPADLALIADIPENFLKINLRSQDFIFTEYFEEADVLKKYDQLLRSVVSGTAEGEFRFKTGDFLYNCDVLVEGIQGLTEDSVDAALNLSGTNKKIKISDSLISSRTGNLSYAGDLELTDKLPLLNGILRISDVLLGDYNLGAALSVYTDAAGNYKVDAESANINELTLNRISADILPYGDSLDFRFSAGVRSNDGSLDFLSSEGNLQIGDDYYIQAAVNTSDFPVAPVLSLLPGNLALPAAIGDLRLTTSFFISGNLKEMAFASPLVLLEDKSSLNNSLGFGISGNNSGFRISAIDLDWQGNRLTGKISADLTKEKDLILSSQFIYNNISIEPSGVFDKNGNLSLIGDYGLKFNLIRNFGDGYNISLKIDRFPFLINAEEPSYFSIDSMAIFNSVKDWRLLINSCSLEQLPVLSGVTRINTSLLLLPDGGSFYNTVFADSYSELKGQGSVLIEELSSKPRGRLQLSAGNTEKQEFYNLQLSLDKDSLKGGLTFSNLPVSRLASELPIDGFFNGAILLDGTYTDPELEISVHSTGVKLNNEPLNINAELSYKDLSLLVKDVSGNSGNIDFNKITGLIDLRNGRQAINGSAEYETRFLAIKTEFNAEAQTSGISALNEIKDLLTKDFSADFNFTKLIVNDESRDLWGIKLQKQHQILTASGGPENTISGSMYEDGYFTLSASSPFPFTFGTSGTFQGGNIDAAIKDINFVFDDLDIPFFHIFEGSLTGSGRIKGKINDPDFFGQINLKDIVFKAPIVEDITQKFSTSIFFREKSITVPATRIPTNNGMVVTTMEAVIDRWLPRTYDMNFKALKDQGISARFNYPPYFVFGFAEGSVRIYGDFITMRIDGDLRVMNTTMIVNPSIEKEQLGRPTDYLIVDLSLKTGENNQVFWPSREVPIVNGFLSADKSLTMRYDSGVSKVVLDGELSLKGGEIFYFKKNFYIKEGGLKFINSTTGSIDPLLSAKAEIRDVNAQGELTKIYLIVDESPFSKFAPRFESEPTLSTAEIISILGGNFTDSLSSSGNFNLTDALLTSVDLFTEFAILQGIEDSLKSTTGLDLLSIRSSFLTNIVEDKFISMSGNTGITNFIKYLDNTTLFLGKYFTDDIFIQGLFQFDLYNNSGYSEGLNIDSEIKLEWESPIANIELSLYPDFYDPVNGLNRTSVGLSWRFSY